MNKHYHHQSETLVTCCGSFVNESQLGVNIGFPMDNVLVSVGSCDKHFLWLLQNVGHVCPFQHINWVVRLNFFFNSDIGYEHEYSNPLDVDILSEFI